MEIRHIRRDELVEVFKLMSLCFEFPFDETAVTDPLAFAAEKEEEAGDPALCDQWWAAFDGDRLMGALNTIPKLATFDGTAQPLVGIGGVSTYPEYRRGGAIRSCFDTLLPVLKQQGVAFSYLFPFSERFYRRYGYEAACQTTVWTIEIDKLPAFEYTGSFTLTDGRTPEVEAVYAAMAQRYNMMICRQGGDFREVNGAHPYRSNRFLYLYRDQHGEPCGYFVFSKVHEGGRAVMDCSELCFTNTEALFAIASFVRRFGADYRVFRFCAPACDDLDALCTEFVHTDTARATVQNGMVRVVDAAAVLRAAAYRGSGHATLYLTDQQIAENNGAFDITFENGRATQVSPSTLAAEQADIAMPIGIFSAAIVGRLDARALRYRPEVCIRDEALAAQLFYTKSNWIHDFF